MLSLPSPFTPDQFARLLPGLRPGLLQWAAQKRPCSVQDAEDLLGEAVRMALLILPEFRPETGADGLRRWMTGILRCVILTDRQYAARRPATVPIADAADLPAPPNSPSSLPDASRASDPSEILKTEIAALPARLQPIVRDWLAGYNQAQIAWRNRIHRNTAGNRLELAFQALGRACPDIADLTYSSSLLDWCSRVAIYTRPSGVWKSWRHTHPRDVRFVMHGRSPAARTVGGERRAA